MHVRIVWCRRAELARTLNSLEVAQRSLEEQRRLSAENAASLRTAATSADSRLADVSEHCEALKGERDKALRQVESSVARIQTVLLHLSLCFYSRSLLSHVDFHLSS